MQISPTELSFSDRTARSEELCRLAEAQRGEPRALDWIFRTYSQAVYALCFRLLSQAADAEDATQATFVQAFGGLAQFRGQASLKTWLYRIAANESMRLLRKRRRDPRALDAEWHVRDSAPEIVEREAVSAALGRMRPEQRLILVLLYWEDLSCEEIAAVLDVSVSAAKMRLKRARDEFQKQFGGER